MVWSSYHAPQRLARYIALHFFAFLHILLHPLAWPLSMSIARLRSYWKHFIPIFIESLSIVLHFSAFWNFRITCSQLVCASQWTMDVISYISTLLIQTSDPRSDVIQCTVSDTTQPIPLSGIPCFWLSGTLWYLTMFLIHFLLSITPVFLVLGYSHIPFHYWSALPFHFHFHSIMICDTST
jgi:hypothetical protein